MSHSRTDRLKSILLREVANIVKNDCKHSFLDGAMVTVVDLTLPKDLSFARVYITTLVAGKEEQVVAILEKQAGFVRKLLGQRLHLKKIPKLHFFKDTAVENIQLVNQLLAQINEPPL